MFPFANSMFEIEYACNTTAEVLLAQACSLETEDLFLYGTIEAFPMHTCFQEGGYAASMFGAGVVLHGETDGEVNIKTCGSSNSGTAILLNQCVDDVFYTYLKSSAPVASLVIPLWVACTALYAVMF
jgi:hypothetical protein